MVTPKKGVYDSLPLNAEGRKLADTLGSGEGREPRVRQCRAYGAANVMRLPGRLHITWEDANTLRIDTDAGTQTRLLRFGRAAQARANRAGRASRWQSGSSRRVGERRGPAT